MIMCSMSSKICDKCGHSCHCRDMCTVRTDEDTPGQSIISICECNDCRCKDDQQDTVYIRMRSNSYKKGYKIGEILGVFIQAYCLYVILIWLFY